MQRPVLGAIWRDWIAGPADMQRNIGRGGFAQRIQPRQSRVQILKSAGMKIGNGDLALVYDDQRGRATANHPRLGFQRRNAGLECGAGHSIQVQKNDAASCSCASIRARRVLSGRVVIGQGVRVYFDHQGRVYRRLNLRQPCLDRARRHRQRFSTGGRNRNLASPPCGRGGRGGSGRRGVSRFDFARLLIGSASQWWSGWRGVRSLDWQGGGMMRALGSPAAVADPVQIHRCAISASRSTPIRERGECGVLWTPRRSPVSRAESRSSSRFPMQPANARAQPLETPPIRPES